MRQSSVEGRTEAAEDFIDDEVLAQAGVQDLDSYAVTPGNRDFLPDFFLD